MTSIILTFLNFNILMSLQQIQNKLSPFHTGK